MIKKKLGNLAIGVVTIALAALLGLLTARPH